MAVLGDRQSRRSLLQKGAVAAGAAWAAPVLLSTGAGAQTGTCLGCGDPLALPFPSGWTESNSGTWAANTEPRGYVAALPAGYAPYFSGSAHFVERDPAQISSEAHYTVEVDLQCGASYTFGFAYVWRDHDTHDRTQSLHAEIKAASDVTWTSQHVVTTSLAGTGDNFHAGTDSLVFVPVVAGPHQFRFRHTFNGAAPPPTIIANDVAVGAPTVTCTPL